MRMTRIMNVMSVAPSMLPPLRTARADPENEHGDRRADHFGQRLREKRDARDANHPLRIPMTRLAEALVLVRLAAERFHEAHPGDDLLQHARDLAVVVAKAPVAATQLPQEWLERRRENRRHDERDEREQVTSSRARSRSRRSARGSESSCRYQLGDERLRLLGVGEDFRDDLPRLGALEVAQRQRCMCENTPSRIARHVLPAATHREARPSTRTRSSRRRAP